jgi:hypothetical protein
MAEDIKDLVDGLPKKLADKRYHVEGELRYVKKQLFRELFALLLTLIKAAGECHMVIWAPIPRWLQYSCCGNPTHCTNRNSDNFAGNMNLALADIRQWLEDMTALRKLINVHIFNPLPALGMTGPDMDIDHALELWGTDRVHATEEGYAALADFVKQLLLAPEPKSPRQPAKRLPRNRDRRHGPNLSAGRAGLPAPLRLRKEIFPIRATRAQIGPTGLGVDASGSTPDPGVAAAAPAVCLQGAVTEEAALAAVPPRGRGSAASAAAAGREGVGDTSHPPFLSPKSNHVHVSFSFLPKLFFMLVSTE